jgi:hypothetical protein
MSFVDVDKLKVTERLPGWRGRYFHAVNMTVAHYEFTRGASIHEHHHPQEELYEVVCSSTLARESRLGQERPIFRGTLARIEFLRTTAPCDSIR